MLDGSGSIDSADFLLEKDFAQNAVAAFANRKLFGNGGTASYVQFSDDVESFGTFVSQADFDAFANGDKQAEGAERIMYHMTHDSVLLCCADASDVRFRRSPNARR